MKALLWRRHFDMRRCVATGSFSLPHGRKAKERIRTYSEYIIYIYMDYTPGLFITSLHETGMIFSTLRCLTPKTPR